MMPAIPTVLTTMAVNQFAGTVPALIAGAGVGILATAFAYAADRREDDERQRRRRPLTRDGGGHQAWAGNLTLVRRCSPRHRTRGRY
jgi:hypothetical protein